MPQDKLPPYTIPLEDVDLFDAGVVYSPTRESERDAAVEAVLVARREVAVALEKLSVAEIYLRREFRVLG